jgi:hypothetical protein
LICSRLTDKELLHLCAFFLTPEDKDDLANVNYLLFREWTTLKENSPCFSQETLALKKRLIAQFTTHLTRFLCMQLVLPAIALYQSFKFYIRLTEVSVID